MRGFYSIYDMANSQFAFAPLVGSTKTAPGKAAAYGGSPTVNLAENSESPYHSGSGKHDKDDKKDKDGFPWWGWVIIGCGIAVVVIVVIIIVVECTGDSEEEEAEAEAQRAANKKAAKAKKDKEQKIKDQAKQDITPKDPARIPTPVKPVDPIKEEGFNDDGTEDFTWDGETPKDEDGKTAVDSFMIKHIRRLIKKAKRSTKKTDNEGL